MYTLTKKDHYVMNQIIRYIITRYEKGTSYFSDYIYLKNGSYMDLYYMLRFKPSNFEYSVNERGIVCFYFNPGVMPEVTLVFDSKDDKGLPAKDFYLQYATTDPIRRSLLFGFDPYTREMMYLNNAQFVRKRGILVDDLDYMVSWVKSDRLTQLVINWYTLAKRN